MFRHVLVGASATREGEDAIALGAAIAELAGSELTLLSCLGISPTPAELEAGLGERRDHAQRQLRAARQRLAPRAQITLVQAADTAQAISTQAERCGADLLVIGSSHGTPVGRCSIGRTGCRLLQHPSATLAVASVGLSAREPRLANIAVGYDGSAASEPARRVAEALARQAGAELLIETVYELSPGSLGGRSDDEDPRAAQRRGALDIARRSVTELSPRARMSVCVGEPGPELRSVSERVDLIVIGLHPAGERDGAVVDGVAGTLPGDFGCSLMIAPMQAQPSAGQAGAM